MNAKTANYDEKKRCQQQQERQQQRECRKKGTSVTVEKPKTEGTTTVETPRTEGGSTTINNICGYSLHAENKSNLKLKLYFLLSSSNG
jgi:hypothetical protein